ncbi:NUDIX domain-containing protein, partial [Streptomyces zhihengii]
MTGLDAMPSPHPRPATEHHGTSALLVDDSGRYLLHLRDAHKPIWRPGQWGLLGGGTEPGESPAEGIARELLEETGLTVPDLAPFLVVD